MHWVNRAQRQRRGGQQGFTLIELLVVIAVLSILAAVVLFNVAGVKNKGNNAACNTDTKSVQTAVDSYSSDVTPANNALTKPQEDITANPTTGNDANLLQPQYLHSIPNPVNSCKTIVISLLPLPPNAPAGTVPASAGFKVVGTAPDGTVYTG